MVLCDLGFCIQYQFQSILLVISGAQKMTSLIDYAKGLFARPLHVPQPWKFPLYSVLTQVVQF